MRKGILASMAVLIISILTASAFAVGLGKDANGNNQAIKEAIENNDYNAWKTAMTSELTEERFNQIVEKHQKMQNRKENIDALKAAIEAEDFEAWQSAVSEMENPPKYASGITEENFDTLVEFYNAKESGDKEKAKELAKELGIHQPQKFKHKAKWT